MARPALLLPFTAAALGACASLVEPAPPRADGAGADGLRPVPPGEVVGAGAVLLPGTGTTRLDLGVFAPRGDLEDLDDGLFAQVAFGRELFSFLSVEASVGYLQADGTNVLGAADVDVWAIPLMLRARASLPVLVFEPYAGIGIGGAWVDADASGLAPGANASPSDFVWAGDAVLGVGIGLGDAAIGVEGRYLLTQEVDDAFELEGLAGTVFVSLPF